MSARDEAVKEASRYYADMQGCNPSDPPQVIRAKTEQIIRQFESAMLARGWKMICREASDETLDRMRTGDDRGVRDVARYAIEQWWDAAE